MSRPVEGDTPVTMKRSRIKYTQEQIDGLERLFEETRYPDTDTQERLALDMDISVDRIAIWFQNRRSKFKRQRQSDQVTWMRKQIFTPEGGKSLYHPFETPQLPEVGPSCHVLSPLTSQLPPRGDSTWSPQLLSPSAPHSLLPHPTGTSNQSQSPYSGNSVHRRSTSGICHSQTHSRTDCIRLDPHNAMSTVGQTTGRVSRTALSTMACNSQVNAYDMRIKDSAQLPSQCTGSVTSQYTCRFMPSPEVTFGENQYIHKPEMTHIGDFLLEGNAFANVSSPFAVQNTYDLFHDNPAGTGHVQLPMTDMCVLEPSVNNSLFESAYQW